MHWLTTNYTSIRPRMGKKNASRRATPSLPIFHNYVSAFTTNKSDPTPCTVIYSLGVVAVFQQQRTQQNRTVLWEVSLFCILITFC